MPIATCEKFHSLQEEVNAAMRTDVDTFRQPLLEKGAAILEAQKKMEQALHEVLREGMEREALLGTLVAAQSQAERVAERFRRARAMFQGDAVAEPIIESHLHEAERFLTWLRDLAARASVPIPPFDESKLPGGPDGPASAGLISISEARARTRARNKA
jgi:hypothetical protein